MIGAATRPPAHADSVPGPEIDLLANRARSRADGIAGGAGLGPAIRNLDHGVHGGTLTLVEAGPCGSTFCAKFRRATLTATPAESAATRSNFLTSGVPASEYSDKSIRASLVVLARFQCFTRRNTLETRVPNRKLAPEQTAPGTWRH